MEQGQLEALANLTFSKYRITCRAKEKIILPPYKGSALRGGFGFALKDISKFYLKKLCEVDSGPNPIVLLPPLDKGSTYAKGKTFSFEITLVGKMVEYFPICRDAVEYLGIERGFGENRGKFDILHIDSAVVPYPDKSTVKQPLIRGDQVALSRKFRGCPAITLHLITRLRLKADDRLLKVTPQFSVLFARIVGRLNSLATFFGDGAIISSSQKSHLLDLAKKIQIARDDAYWAELPRFSTKQKKWMKYDGLLGKITYKGDLAPFLPYLTVAELLHVGGKTTCGLGKIVMESNEEMYQWRFVE